MGWEQEEIELLTDSIGKIRAILNLIDLRIAGDAQRGLGRRTLQADGRMM